MTDPPKISLFSWPLRPGSDRHRTAAPFSTLILWSLTRLFVLFCSVSPILLFSSIKLIRKSKNLLLSQSDLEKKTNIIGFSWLKLKTKSN